MLWIHKPGTFVYSFWVELFYGCVFILLLCFQLRPVSLSWNWLWHIFLTQIPYQCRHWICFTIFNSPRCSWAFLMHKFSVMDVVRTSEETSSEVFLCGCKQTTSPPFCDGTRVWTSPVSWDHEWMNEEAQFDLSLLMERNMFWRWTAGNNPC